MSILERFRTHECDGQGEFYFMAKKKNHSKLIITIVVAVLAIMFLATQAFAKEPTEERLKFFLKFAGEALGEYTHDITLPRIIYISSENIQLEYYGAEAIAKLKDNPGMTYPKVLAIYDTGTLILNEDVDYTDPENEPTIVHEFVHHIQHVKDIHKGPCIRADEPVAYHAQNMWVMATGKGQLADALSIFLYSQCPSESLF
jgi:hypothetical protein